LIVLRNKDKPCLLHTKDNVADEEISEHKRMLGIDFMLDIVDDTGECFRVGFAWSGIAIIMYLPPDYRESILVPPPPLM